MIYLRILSCKTENLFRKVCPGAASFTGCMEQSVILGKEQMCNRSRKLLRTGRTSYLILYDTDSLSALKV